MRATTMFLTLALPLLSGCGGAFWGNLVVLAITAGIFVGTLSLGRNAESRSSDSSSESSS